jgi:hypothetical protein
MSGENKQDERYIAAYDAAQQLHRRMVENSKVNARLTEIFSAQGKALRQIKDFARVSFMLIPDATEEGFEQLWREAFQVETEKKGSIAKRAEVRSERRKRERRRQASKL